jgi:TonB family protein
MFLSSKNRVFLMFVHRTPPQAATFAKIHIFFFQKNMKYTLTLLLALGGPLWLAAQDPKKPTSPTTPPQEAIEMIESGEPAPPPVAPPPSEKTYEIFDIQTIPEFPGGQTALQQFLADNIRYPALARENNIQGTVVLSFVIDKDGSANNISVLRDPGGGCGKEAARVVSLMPRWTPGQANGKPVRVKYTLPVRFRLEDDAPAPVPTNRIFELAELDRPPVSVHGSLSELETWLSQHLDLKKKYRRQADGKSVRIRLVVGANGSIRDVQTIADPVQPHASEAVMQALEKLGDTWKPGQKGGKNVATRVELNVPIKKK